MRVLRPKDLRRQRSRGHRESRDKMAQLLHPQPAPRHMTPTHRGTKESVFCNVVGSSSKSEAMSLPWGTATRRYLIFSPAFRRPMRPCAPWWEDPNSGRSPSLTSGPLKPLGSHPRGLHPPAHHSGFRGLHCPAHPKSDAQSLFPRPWSPALVLTTPAALGSEASPL